MVARPGQYQSSLNAGELSPDVWGRSDIKQFYSGASLMVNAEPVPQGGFDNLPGSREAGAVRRQMTPVSQTSVSFTPGPWAGPGVVYAAIFAPSRVSCVDLNGLASTVELAGALVLETSTDGVNFTPFGAAQNSAPSPRVRRVGVAPGAGVLATSLRLRLTTAPASPTTFSLTTLVIFEETALNVSAARQFEHAFSTVDAFTITLTPGHADIFKGDAYVASVATSVTAAMLPTIKREQRLNSMIVFHVDLPPFQIMRMTSDSDWSGASAPFINVPLVDYGLSYGNLVTDVWGVTLQWSSGPVGLSLEINVNGEATSAIALGGAPDWAAFVASLQVAIEALPSVGAGVIVTNDPPAANSITIYIQFAGVTNNGQRFAVTPRVTNVPWASAVASHLAFGDPGGEEIMSATRGWPATGNFFQDRLYLAGFRSQSGAVLGSVTGEYFDLNARLENVAGGLLFRIDTSGAEQVEFLARSKHLVIFTNEAEYFVSDRAIARGTPPNTPQSTRNGIAPGVRPVENDGSLLYVGRSRSIIYSALYSDVSQSYETEPVSLLASHLVKGVRETAIQRASLSTDAARYWVVRDDGLMIVGVMIRNQDVMAFVRWQTDGAVRDVCVDGANVPYALVEREVDGEPRLFRERLTSDAILHQERVFSFGSPATSVTGLDSFEGATVWAFCDGYAQGPFTVADGAITLPYPATTVTVGRWTPPIVDTLPLPRLVGERTHLARPVRVHTVRAQAQGATSLAIGANGRPAREVALLRGGQVSDQPIQPYSGPVCAHGFFGWTDEGIVRFTQLRPGRLKLRNITIEARV